MAKKNFTTAPRPRQPTADAITAFEQGGAGHDRAETTSAPAAPHQTERSKRLSLDLPQSVHTRFKTACSATGRKMVSEIHEFIERRIAELESEAGIARK
jgi:hypothetical protein